MSSDMTPVAILNRYSKQVQLAVVYSPYYGPNCKYPNDRYKFQVALGPLVGEGEARRKKTAKQMAAWNLLLQLPDPHGHLTPPATPELSRHLVESLMAQDETSWQHLPEKLVQIRAQGENYIESVENPVSLLNEILHELNYPSLVCREAVRHSGGLYVVFSSTGNPLEWTFWGFGHSLKEAFSESARNGLKFLLTLPS